MGQNFEKRLRNIEQKLAKMREKDCNCGALVLLTPGGAEEFRAEMNRICPAHGFRDFQVMHIVIDEPYPPTEFPTAQVIEPTEEDAVLEEYLRRLAEAKRTA